MFRTEIDTTSILKLFTFFICILSFSVNATGQVEISLKERLLKFELMNESSDLQWIENGYEAVNEMNLNHKLRNSNLTHKLDSVVGNIVFNSIVKFEFVYGDNCVYQFITGYEEITDRWIPSRYVYWEFDESQNLVKNINHDWNGDKIMIKDDEPNCVYLFEYDENDQLTRSLYVFQPHLQQQLNYDTIDYSYNSKGLLSSLISSSWTFETSSTIVSKSEVVFTYNDNSQIISDSLFTYIQEEDTFVNSGNQFFVYSQEGLLIESTSEKSLMGSIYVPFDSIGYVHFDSDRLQQKQVWMWEDEMKIDKEINYTYNLNESMAIDEISTFSLYREDIGDWQKGLIENYDYILFADDSYSLSKINYSNLNVAWGYNSQYSYDESVPSGNILYPPNYTKRYYENHMLSKESNLLLSGTVDVIDYYYSKVISSPNDNILDDVLTVTPNPFTNKIKIVSSTSNQKYDIRLYDMTGCFIGYKNIYANEEMLFPNLISGTYIYVISRGDKIKSGLIFKN